MTKVISFSLWGDKAKYTIGAIRNAGLAPIVYPGWECWYYISTHEIVPTEYPMKGLTFPSYWKTLTSVGDHVKVKWIDRQPDWRMMFDRFLPAADPEVEVMISRDCDSRLSLREKAAVDEWLESDKGWHAMRDHPYHSVPMLGGMWGVKQGAITPDKFRMMIRTWNQQDRLQTDQEFLAQEVWPRYRNDFMVHDDGFYTHHWPCHGNKLFPKPRSGLEFVGQVFDENEITVSEHLAALAKAL
jgi:hypothetical protein